MTSAEAGLILAFVEVRSITDEEVARGRDWYKLYSRFMQLEGEAYKSYYHGQFDTVAEALYSLRERHELFGVQFREAYVSRLLKDHTF